MSAKCGQGTLVVIFTSAVLLLLLRLQYEKRITAGLFAFTDCCIISGGIRLLLLFA